MRDKFFLAVLFIIALVTSSFNYKHEKKISVFLKEYDYIFTPQKQECNDTIIDKLDNNRMLKIFLSDCKGKMHVICYRAGKKIEEGDYINSLDLLKKYSYGVNGVSGHRKVIVSEYYQPLRSGEWLFFNSKGEVRDKKIYKEGILQD